MTLHLKRVYDAYDESDGYRVLVDRLWPRGVSKERAAVDLWLKEIAPTPQLRTWWDHDPKTMIDFEERYRAELDENPAVATLRGLLAGHPVVTLLYGARDPVVNHARILAEYVG